MVMNTDAMDYPSDKQQVTESLDCIYELVIIITGIRKVIQRPDPLWELYDSFGAPE